MPHLPHSNNRGSFKKSEVYVVAKSQLQSIKTLFWFSWAKILALSADQCTTADQDSNSLMSTGIDVWFPSGLFVVFNVLICFLIGVYCIKIKPLFLNQFD